MNFDRLPELHWRYGYEFFWSLCAVITLLFSLVLTRFSAHSSGQ